MWTQGRIKEWLLKRLEAEWLWTGNGEAETAAENLAKRYTPGDGRWRAQPWTEQVPRPRPLNLVTRGGMKGIYRNGDERKADAVARALNELETAMVLLDR